MDNAVDRLNLFARVEKLGRPKITDANCIKVFVNV